MEISKGRSHPRFGFPGSSRLFRNCWLFQLKPGEDTRHRFQSSAEEVYVILAGIGRMTVGGTTSLVREGDVVLVPPRVSHHLENAEPRLLRGLSIEAAAEGAGEDAPRGAGAPAEGPEATSLHGGTLEEVVEALPELPGEAEAIRAIVELFEVSGSLSERIAGALGLDNALGTRSLNELEKLLLGAVGTVIDRYREGREGPRFPRRWG